MAFCMGHAQLFRSESDFTSKVLELVKRSLLRNDRVVLSETLVLAEDLAILMQSKFIPHLTKLLDPLLWSLQKDAELLDPVLRSLQQDNTAAMSVPLADVKEFILLKLEALPVLCQFAESHVLNLVLPPLVQMVKQISLPVVVRRMAVITISRFNRMFDLAEWTALVLPPLCQVLTKMTVPQYPRLPGETSQDLAEIDLWAHLISLLKSFIIKVGGQQPSTVRMLRRTLAATLRPWNQSAIAAIQSVRGVRARSARILIISLMIVSSSCLSLMISTRKSTLSLASLIYFALEHKRSECSLECYEILNSRFALDHRYGSFKIKTCRDRWQNFWNVRV